MIIRYLDHLHYFFGLINVIQAEEYPRPDFTEMIKNTVRMLEEYNIRFDNSCRIFVDTANPSFITTLKQAVNEDLDYVKQIAFYEHNYPSIYDLQFLQQNMFVIPVPFLKAPEHAGTLQRTNGVSEWVFCHSSTI